MRMEWVGGELNSFQKGSECLGYLLLLRVSPKELQKLTEKFGKERKKLRDAEVARFERGELKPEHPQAPGVVAITVDGGRVQIRQEGAGVGVHGQRWTEDKVAHLATFSRKDHAVDPQPDPPAFLLDPHEVPKLIESLKGARGHAASSSSSTAETTEDCHHSQNKEDRSRTKPILRTVIATLANAEQFGKMVAAEATRRGFYQAPKGAFLGDGSHWIWNLRDLHFPDFTGVLDFLHLVSYLYAGARTAYPQRSDQAWILYKRLARLAWSGQSQEVLEVLQRHSDRIGKPPQGASDDDPRKILSDALHYVATNQKRMEYPRYRREGLPTSSAYVESLIKQVNRRVKSTEKFWVEDGLEAMLAVRSAYLSADGRADRFWLERAPGARAVGRNRFQLAA